MQFFRVKNWDGLQHYRDRTPPWIKLYNHLLDDYEFACLQDASKLHLVLIWLLASRTSNRMPFNKKWIKSKIGVDSEVDLNALLESGFILLEPSNDGEIQLMEQDASNVLADCKQHADTEERRAEERESRGEDKKNIVSKLTDTPQKDLVRDVFDHWRNVMGKGSAKLTNDRRNKIMSRIREGYTKDDLIKAIDGCSRSDWNMGRDPKSNGKFYNELELIFRNGTNVEKFIANLDQQKNQDSNTVPIDKKSDRQVVRESLRDINNINW